MNAITQKIIRRSYFVAARNEIEARFIAAAKFARDEIVGCQADLTRSSLNHHTTNKPVYQCNISHNGEIGVKRV